MLHHVSIPHVADNKLGTIDMLTRLTDIIYHDYGLRKHGKSCFGDHRSLTMLLFFLFESLSTFIVQ